MCANLISQQGHINQYETPPPTSSQFPFLIHYIQELGIEDDEQQLREYLTMHSLVITMSVISLV